MDHINYMANNDSSEYTPAPGPLLKNIQSPADLKKLPKTQLREISDELRQFIIDIVSVHGGHFGASLGVVELTVALHSRRIFSMLDGSLKISYSSTT